MSRARKNPYGILTPDLRELVPIDNFPVNFVRPKPDPFWTRRDGSTVLDNLTLLAVVIIVFWMAAMAYYIYTSRQQQEIRKELQGLRSMLDEVDAEQE